MSIFYGDVLGIRNFFFGGGVSIIPGNVKTKHGEHI